MRLASFGAQCGEVWGKCGGPTGGHSEGTQQPWGGRVSRARLALSGSEWGASAVGRVVEAVTLGGQTCTADS